MFSPAISALLEKTLGIQTIMYAIPILYFVIMLMLVAVLKTFNRNSHKESCVL